MSGKPTYEELKRRIKELKREAVTNNEVIEILQESKEFNVSLLKNSPHSIIVINQDTSIRYVNPALEKLTGFYSEELIGSKAPYPWWTKETLQKTASDFTIAIRSGAQKLEELFQKKNGERFWVEITSFQVKMNGKFMFYISNWVEITERKHAEKALQQSEEKLAGIIASLPDHMSMIDEQYNIVWANDVAKSLFGPDLVAQNCYRVYHGRDKPCEPCVVRRSFEDGKVHDHQTEVVGADGNKMIFWCTASVVTWHIDGKPKVVLEVSRNITNQERAKEILQSERDKFQGVLNALGEGMYIVNRDFIIEYQNDLLKERFGDTIGKKCYAAYMGLDKQCEKCPIPETIKTGKIHNVEIVAADGRSYEISSSLFTDKDGNTKAIELAKDVTQKKALEAEAIRAGHLASIGELAAGVAHEVNNPTHAIINLAQILLNEFDQKSQEYDVASRISKEGDRIADIVGSLLSFARDDRKEEKRSINLYKIMSDTLALTKAQIRKDGIDIKMDISPSLPEIIAHSQQIQQVFLNIITNARYALNQRYSGAYEDKILEILGEELTINTRSYIRTTFLDRGIGIPANEIENVVNPFYSRKPNGIGTGLGLSISHGIIGDHGGKLSIESVEGEFTKVTIDLPARGKDES